MAAAAAEKTGPALFTLGFCHYMGIAEFFHQVRPYDTRIQRSHLILLPSNKLVAGIDFTGRGNSIVLMSGAAARQPR